MQERYEVGDRIENLGLEVTEPENGWEGGWTVMDREMSQIVAITPTWGAVCRIAHALNVLDQLERNGVVRMSLERDVPR